MYTSYNSENTNQVTRNTNDPASAVFGTYFVSVPQLPQISYTHNTQ